jgi:hypothetical protein
VAALRAHGIRTIVDLRNDDERAGPAAAPVSQEGLTVVHVPLDDVADTAFWRRIWDDGLDGTPLTTGRSWSRSWSGAPPPWPREVVLTTLEAVDVEAVLRAGGLSDRRRRAVRRRLLESGRR